MRAPPAQHPQLPIGGRPVAAGGQRHGEMGRVEEERRAIQAPGGDSRERRPALRHAEPDEVEPPEERDRVVQVAGDGRRRPLEGAPPEPRGSLVVAPGQVHQREVPQQMVPEPSQMRARVDCRGQARDPRVERRHLVERMRERVDRPGVARIFQVGGARQTHCLVAAARLLEGEGMQAEHEGITGLVTIQRAGERQHGRELPLPEPDEIEALENDQVPRILRQMLPHRAFGLGHLALDQEREGFDVAPLAFGLGAHGGTRDLRRLLRFGEALLEKEADRRAGVAQSQSRVVGVRRAKEVEGPTVPREEPFDGAIVGLERRRRSGAHGQAVGVAAHERHASRPVVRRRPGPRGAQGIRGGRTTRGSRGRGARPTTRTARARSLR